MVSFGEERIALIMNSIGVVQESSFGGLLQDTE